MIYSVLSVSGIQHSDSEIVSISIHLSMYSFFRILFPYRLLQNIVLMYLFLALLGLHCSAPASLAAGSRGYSSLQCSGFSLWRLLWLPGAGSRQTSFSGCSTWAQHLCVQALECGPVFAAHGLSCSVACGVFSDQGLNLCPLHWQADSYPPCHQRSPPNVLSRVPCAIR